MKASKIYHWWTGGSYVDYGKFINYINNNKSVDLGVFYQSVDPQNLIHRIWIPYNRQYATYYEVKKEQSASDNYYTPSRDCGIMEYFEVRMPDSSTGTFQGYGVNGFAAATVVGSTITLTFTGTGLKFRHNADNQGGVWQFNFNSGQHIVDISTYSSSTITRKLTDIKLDLPYGTHTVVGTFTGDDPLNVPVGGAGTSKAWVAADTTSTGTNANLYDKAFWIQGSPTPNHCDDRNLTAYVSKISSTLTDSYKEYAFNTKALGAAYASDWLPNHNTISTASVFANLATDRTLKVDGGSDRLGETLWTFATAADEIILYEVYKGVNGSDTNDYLFDFTFESKFDKNGNHITVSATLLQDLGLSTLYTSMFDVLHAYGSVALFNGLAEFNYPGSASTTEVISNANMTNWDGQIASCRKTGTDLQKSYAVAMKMDNPSSALQLSSSRGQRLWQETVISGTARTKIYCAAATAQNSISAPLQLTWTTHFQLGVVPDAYNVLSAL